MFAPFLMLHGAAEVSNLDDSLWEIRGPDAANVALANDDDGYLVVTFSATTGRTYIRPVTPPVITNGTVRAIMRVEGWDSTTDQIVAGPGIRLSGTTSGTMGGYFVAQRRYGNLTGDPFKWRPGRVVGGALANIGSESSNVSGGLLDIYSDMRITAMANGANADVTVDCRRELQIATEFSATITGDTAGLTGTDPGIFIRSATTAHTIRVKFFEAA